MRLSKTLLKITITSENYFEIFRYCVLNIALIAPAFISVT